VIWKYFLRSDVNTMTFQKEAHYEFARLCAMEPTTDLTLANIRKIVLYQTQGLCPVYKLIDVNNGSVRNTKSVCAATADDVKGRWQFWRSWRTSMDQHVAKLMMQDQTAHSKKRMLTPLQMYRLEVLIAAHHSHKNLAAFRLAILESASPAFSVRAIHFFRWDGTCRASPEEIQTAMVRYASTKQGMSLAWKVALGVTVAASALAATTARVMHEREVPVSPPLTEDEFIRLRVVRYNEIADKLRLVGRMHSHRRFPHYANAEEMRHEMIRQVERLDAMADQWILFHSLLLTKPPQEMNTAIRFMTDFKPVDQEGRELKDAMGRYRALSESSDARTVRDATTSLATKLRDALRHDEDLIRHLKESFSIP
jgi:hypothetical protein